jgi:opacity protein-like surface antigen
MRTILIITVAIFSSASLAAAQVPTSGNVFFGYSYLNADLSSLGRSNFNGYNASLEGKIFPWVGLVADFSETYGSENVAIPCPGPPCPSDNFTGHEYNMLFGPRVGVSIGKIRPFGEAFFGVGHVSVNNVGSDTSFATGLGGGLDYRIFRPIAVRFEGDYLQTRFFGSTQNNVRFSTGIVFRF